MSRSHLHVIEPVVAIAKNWANTGKLYKLVMLHAKFQLMLNYCLRALCYIFEACHTGRRESERNIVKSLRSGVSYIYIMLMLGCYIHGLRAY